MVALLPISFFLLSAAYLLSKISPSSQNEVEYIQQEPLDILNLEEGDIEKTEQWKDNEWHNWKLKLEEDWDSFSVSLLKDKKEFMKIKTSELNGWIILEENKWNNFSEYLSEEYKNYLLNKSAKWDDIDWEKWANTEMIAHLDKDYKTWSANTEQSIKDLVRGEWNKWQHDKVSSWLSSSWKQFGAMYWDLQESRNWDLYSHSDEMKEHWIKWNDRNNRENTEWSNWVQNKEYFITYAEHSDIEQWKYDNYSLYNTWRKDFINKWVLEKRWNSILC
ncbi:tryptophan-rich antigen [Plasmodium cynomolgi strain B]|uniref:Tryptophan-rich antigen n=1 Tax=Plasmodium cynomolgi (strain B) TaxID=1120755 RepID=K6UMK3_PLACD|nr:tryptophan-rich antigen [Plasmodium cynomolgi strain B]GAB68678.1 tryptophan-rich antigen [Plasmodium cynomolgi strain B]